MRDQPQKASLWFWIALAGVLLLSRLCHRNILWADEDYHLAAAIQMLHGKMLYRDLWYDKPPLNAIVAVLFGAWPGWPLRIVSALIAAASCLVAFRFASALWSRREGYWAAGALAFSLIFYLPSATIPLEPDTLMILPHLAAVYLAWRRRPLAAGLIAGLAFAMNLKGLLVLIVCMVFAPGGAPVMLAGFLIPNAVLLAWLGWTGALPGYVESVWRWGILYAGAPPGDSPLESALVRLRNWFGFHAALLLAAGWYWLREKELGHRAKMLAWAVLSLAAAGVGWRFSPHYLNQLLPPLAIAGARGICLLAQERRSSMRLGAIVLAIAAVVPTIRFGPRYFLLAADDLAGRPHDWRDVALDQESRQAAALVQRIERPGDTIFVWGYRPNVVVYTQLPVASRMWESQPLTGVPADRHLGDVRSMDPEWARRNRAELVRSSPSILVDGLSAYNPRLSLANYPDLAEWFRRYCLAGRAGGVAVYQLCARE